MDQDIVEKSRRYCSRCGNPIDPITKQCEGCGKQYFKGIPWRKVFLTLFVFLFIISAGLNVIFIMVCNDFSDENSQQSMAIDEMRKEKINIEIELKSIYKQFDEINRSVVFIEDDQTRLYHRFSCEKNLGQSFWAYNLDLAKEKGYKPCELCHNTKNSTSLTWDEDFDKLMIKHAVGEDYEITVEELRKLPPKELNWLLFDDVVLMCNDWKGLYHSAACERLTGMCTVTVEPIAKADGFMPCPICRE